jgi:hypothetical protein
VVANSGHPNSEKEKAQMSPAAATANKAAVPAGLTVVASLTEVYADAHRALAARVRTLDDEMRASKKRHLPSIIKLASAAKEAYTNLEASLEENKGVFAKPKTRTFFGITVGFRKRVGTMQWADDEAVVALIKKLFKPLADVLIKTTEKPVADAIGKLPASDVKKLGITVGEDTDAVVIKVSDTEVDKLVSALMKDSGASVE